MGVGRSTGTHPTCPDNDLLWCSRVSIGYLKSDKKCATLNCTSSVIQIFLLLQNEMHQIREVDSAPTASCALFHWIMKCLNVSYLIIIIRGDRINILSLFPCRLFLRCRVATTEWIWICILLRLSSSCSRYDHLHESTHAEQVHRGRAINLNSISVSLHLNRSNLTTMNELGLQLTSQRYLFIRALW